MNNKSELKQQGAEGEEALKEWFDKNGLAYVHVCQAPDTFANLFRDAVKRLDFLLLFESIGLLAVDAKKKSLYSNSIYGKKLDSTESEKYKSDRGWVSLNDEKSEIMLGLAFERIFRMPFWYAIEINDSAKHAGKRYWISALKVLEVGVHMNADSKKQDFLNVSLDDCVCIAEGDDLGKLYTQRVNSYHFLK